MPTEIFPTQCFQGQILQLLQTVPNEGIMVLSRKFEEDSSDGSALYGHAEQLVLDIPSEIEPGPDASEMRPVSRQPDPEFAVDGSVAAVCEVESQLVAGVCRRFGSWRNVKELVQLTSHM